MDGSDEKKTFASEDTHQDNKGSRRRSSIYDVDTSKSNVDAVFENPLALVSEEAVMSDVEDFCREFDLMDQLENFKKGAKASRSPEDIPTAEWLTDSEREVLLREKTHKWEYPKMLYFLTSMPAHLHIDGHPAQPSYAVLLTSVAKSCVRWQLQHREWTRRQTTGPYPYTNR